MSITNPDEAIRRVLAGDKASDVLQLCSIEFPYTRSDWYQAAQTLSVITSTPRVVIPNLVELIALSIGFCNLCDAERKSALQRIEAQA